MFIVLKKKIIITVAACILTIIAIPVAIHYTNNAAEAVQASTSANTNWGLSFPKDGGTPTGNASSEFCSNTTLLCRRYNKKRSISYI